MRQIKEVLRQHYELGFNHSEIARNTTIPRSTVRDYFRRFNASGLSWPLPEEIDEDELNALLFPPPVPSHQERFVPKWTALHQELKRKGVTLQLLWEEYHREHPNGYQYSWFSECYRKWAKSQDVWMPQTHKAGDKTFVDYSGLTFPIWTTNLQKVAYQAEIFVGVLGASDLVFCLASANQKLESWIEAHIQMFSYFGGVSALLVPDNLRSAVSKAHRYEPACNRSYEEMAAHYGCAIMPARSYKPKDKAKAEKSVQMVQQRILAPLRDKRFSGLESLNQAFRHQLETLNNQNFQKHSYSRWDLFVKIEKAALLPLPSTHYHLARWFKERASGGYHVCIYLHYYSIPYEHARKTIDVRITENTIECFYKEKLIAAHVRNDTPGTYTTVDHHQPEAHRQQAMWQQERLQEWANSIGPHTSQFITMLFADEKRHLHQKERSALGIMRLSHVYNEIFLEQACEQALAISTVRYDSMESIIKRLANKACQDTSEQETSYETPEHNNIRGADYYH